jgi:hypothetical protein
VKHVDSSLSPAAAATGLPARRILTRLLLTLVLIAAAACSAKPARTQAQPGAPNIVVILADNLGYGEVGA